MSLLLGPEGARADGWTRVEDGADLSLHDGAVIVPLAAIDQALGDRRAAPLGLHVANDTALTAIEPFLQQVALVSVAFPSFSDGRGLSLARRLRRAGFTGTLRAAGPLIADQFAEALLCGFDEVEVPADMAARQPVGQWTRALGIVGEHYQTGYGAGESILEKRRAAAAAGRGPEDAR